MKDYRPSKYVEIENTTLIFKPNFLGVPINQYDDPRFPTRYVKIVIPNDIAYMMEADGWTGIKQTNPTEKYPEPQAYIKATIKYKDERPDLDPKIYLITEGNIPQLLNKESIKALQDAWIKNVSVQLTHWWDSEHRRWNTYVRAMTVHVDESRHYTPEPAPIPSFLQGIE